MPVVEDMTVPFSFHGQLIGQKGKEIRQIMDECGVTVAIPRPDERSDVIQIIGPPSKIDGARKMIEKKLQSLEEERKQRASMTMVVFRSTPPSRRNNIGRGLKCPSVGTSVRPSTKSLSDFSEIW